MANIASARKRARQSERQRLHKASQRSMLRTYIKNVVSAIQKKDKAAAISAYSAAMPIIDRMANRGVIHRNKAARHKSRLNEQIRALS